MEATTNKYKRIKGINKTVPLFSKTDENITKVTHDELVELRDNGKLLPGHFYRITDYEFTFNTPNVKSAGHQFDIVLVALSKKELAEEGWAMMSDKIDMFDDYEEFDVIFTKTNVKIPCYLKFNESASRLVNKTNFMGRNDLTQNELTRIDNENHIIYIDNNTPEEIFTIQFYYNYFQSSDLSAWKVWYCLDNDEGRFNWAKPTRNDIPAYMNNAYIIKVTAYGSEETIIVARNKDKDNNDNNIGVKLYAYDMIRDETNFEIVQTLYTTEESISIGTLTLYILSGDTFLNIENMGVININKYKYINGKGVIYRLIDEHNNDCCCDFKNYMFMNTDKTDYYTYILNGNEVHDNKIDITDSNGIKCLPRVLLIGESIFYNNIVNSNHVYIGDTTSDVVYNNIINCSFIDVYNTCYNNILSRCDTCTFTNSLYNSTLINIDQIDTTNEVMEAYIINCNNIHLGFCKNITMFNCVNVTFQKDYIYNLLARDIGNVTITSDSTTSITSIIKNVEILPGIGITGRMTTITLPLFSNNSCTIVKPNTVNEIIVS